MMKRLLTTTMLASAVTFGGAMSAHAFDLTIAGDSKLSYKTWSDDEDNTDGANDSKIVNESHVIIQAEETSDSGLTYGTYFRIEAEGLGENGDDNLKEDGHRFYVSGDFGKVVFGGSSAGDTHYSDVFDRNIGDEGNTGKLTHEGNEKLFPSFGYQTAKSGDETISYHTPSLGGFSGAVSFSDAGSGSGADARELGLSYSHDFGPAALTLRYAAGSKDEDGKKDGKEDATSYGFDVKSGRFGFHVSTNKNTANVLAIPEVPAILKEDEKDAVLKGTTGKNAADLEGVPVTGYVVVEEAVVARDAVPAVPAFDRDLSNLGYAATFQASDNLKLALGRGSAEYDYAKGVETEATQTAFTADYTIAPGLTAGLGYTKWDGSKSVTTPTVDKDEKVTTATDTTKQSGTYTVLYMKVAF